MTRPRARPLSPVARLRAHSHGNAGASLGAQVALVWLLLALVLVPALGRLHQVVHAPALPNHALTAPAPLAMATASQAGAPTAAAGHVAAHAHGLLDALLAPHAPVDCLLLDQLALGDALHSAPLVLTPPLPAQAAPEQPGATAAPWHVAFFQARGPPLRA